MRDAPRVRWLIVRTIGGGLVLVLAGCEERATPSLTPAVSTVDASAPGATEAGRLLTTVWTFSRWAG